MQKSTAMTEAEIVRLERRFEEFLRKTINEDERSVYRIAKESGVSAGQLSRFLGRERSITISTLARLMLVLGLEIRRAKKNVGASGGTS